MTKTLKVKDPFLRLDFGDTFELDESGNSYTSTVQEDFSDVEDNGSEYTTKYHATFTISKDYAAKMIEDGYLEEVSDKKEFVNVFSEIDDLLNMYKDQLDEVTKNAANTHPAVQREKETVLTNLVTVLNHLKSLKK